MTRNVALTRGRKGPFSKADMARRSVGVIQATKAARQISLGRNNDVLT
jgi:hypothetical protein